MKIGAIRESRLSRRRGESSIPCCCPLFCPLPDAFSVLCHYSAGRSVASEAAAINRKNRVDCEMRPHSGNSSTYCYFSIRRGLHHCVVVLPVFQGCPLSNQVYIEEGCRNKRALLHLLLHALELIPIYATHLSASWLSHTCAIRVDAKSIPHIVLFTGSSPTISPFSLL